MAYFSARDWVLISFGKEEFGEKKMERSRFLRVRFEWSERWLTKLEYGLQGKNISEICDSAICCQFCYAMRDVDTHRIFECERSWPSMRDRRDMWGRTALTLTIRTAGFWEVHNLHVFVILSLLTKFSTTNSFDSKLYPLVLYFALMMPIAQLAFSPLHVFLNIIQLTDAECNSESIVGFLIDCD